MAELSNEKIIGAHELRAYQRLVLPRKETVGKEEIAVNNAGALLVKDAAGVTQTISSVLPPNPGFAAVSAADGSSITRSITVVGAVSATGFAGQTAAITTALTTPLINTIQGSNAVLTVEADGGKVVLAGDGLLAGVTPSSAVTVSTTAGNTTVSVDAGSTALCGIIAVNVTLATSGAINIVVPRASTNITDVLTFLTTRDGDVIGQELLVNAGATTYQPTTFTIELLFTCPVPGTRRIQYFNVCRS